MKQLDLFPIEGEGYYTDLIDALMRDTGESKFECRCALEDHLWNYDCAYLELIRG